LPNHSRKDYDGIVLLQQADTCNIWKDCPILRHVSGRQSSAPRGVITIIVIIGMISLSVRASSTSYDYCRCFLSGNRMVQVSERSSCRHELYSTLLHGIVVGYHSRYRPPLHDPLVWKVRKHYCHSAPLPPTCIAVECDAAPFPFLSIMSHVYVPIA
jgi:hypothetical protein